MILQHHEPTNQTIRNKNIFYSKMIAIFKVFFNRMILSKLINDFS